MTAPKFHDDQTQTTRRRVLTAITLLLAMAVSSVEIANAAPKQKNTDQSSASRATPENASTTTTQSADPAKAPAAPTDPTKPAAQADAPPDVWTDSEIADARAHCAVVLERVHAVALPHAPIREGACGAPAPVELISIGQNPEVAVSPPAIVRCDLVEQLANWLEKDLQPLARKHLKSPIIRIETMSSYSCRNAYGRKGAKLSEHGLADAVDIGGFITASAKNAEVLDEWGKPKREILAEAEAQKAAAEQAAAKTAQAGVTGNPAQGMLPSALPMTAGAAAAGLVRSTIIDGLPKPEVIATSDPISDPSRLGGPPQGRKSSSGPRTTAFFEPPSGDNPDPAMRAFLHDAHKAACRIFGTTLGPEANAAHRNHFHVDMAPRTFAKICD